MTDERTSADAANGTANGTGTGTGKGTGTSAGTGNASTAEAPWPVRVVSQKLGAWIAKLGWIWVDGQVAQITRRPGSSVVFITLRDPSADLSLSVTAHRDVLDTGAPSLADGARILVHAKPEFYAGRGTLSLRADEVRQVGLGELLARLEQLKKLLAAEGLFDPRRKRRLPFLPARIGLITGRASAAERDVLTNARRRWPAVEFRVVNVAVQGTSSVPQMIDALSVLDKDPTIDVIVLARGGGSTEDLLPFSDEALCRAVFACRTPVVSAIGHETDAPLVDYVADVRASTPTDAAKRIVPDLADELRLIAQARGRLRRSVTHFIDREAQRIASVRSRPVLANPSVIVDVRATDIEGLRRRADRVFANRLDRGQADVEHTTARLRALSPAATLHRGYAIVQRVNDGRIVRDPADLGTGDALRIRVAGGDVGATVSAPTEAAGGSPATKAEHPTSTDDQPASNAEHQATKAKRPASKAEQPASKARRKTEVDRSADTPAEPAGEPGTKRGR